MARILRREPVDLSVEKQIVTAMVVSDTFLASALSMYRPQYIQSAYLRTVAGWCSEYYQNYRKAPGRHVRDLFDNWRDTAPEEEVDLVEDLLKELNDRFTRAGEFNEQYLLASARERFRARSMHELTSSLGVAMANGSVEEAEKILTEWKRVDLPVSCGVSPLTDADHIRRSFEIGSEMLIRLPGAIGQLMNRHLIRSGLVSLLGPEKRGKTWWLIELAMRGLMARRNVAVFAVGDMTKEQMTVRMGIWECRKSDDPEYCGEILVPYMDCRTNRGGTCRSEFFCGKGKWNPCKTTEEEITRNPGHVKCHGCRFQNVKSSVHWRPCIGYSVRREVEPLTWREVYRKGSKLQKALNKQLVLIDAPTRTMNTEGIRQALRREELYSGFIPDIIVIDYADILAPERQNRDSRHDINETWMALRRLSQEYKALVLTATQADADSYEAETISSSNFSWDKRKQAHLTAEFGLNQTPEEKDRGIMRVNIVMGREGRWNPTRTVTCLQSLETGRPCLDSEWTDDLAQATDTAREKAAAEAPAEGGSEKSQGGFKFHKPMSDG